MKNLTSLWITLRVLHRNRFSWYIGIYRWFSFTFYIWRADHNSWTIATWKQLVLVTRAMAHSLLTTENVYLLRSIMKNLFYRNYLRYFQPDSTSAFTLILSTGANWIMFPLLFENTLQGHNRGEHKINNIFLNVLIDNDIYLCIKLIPIIYFN